MGDRNICLFINLFVCFFAKGQTVFTAIPANQKVVYDTARQITGRRTSFTNFDIHPYSNTLIKTVPPTFYYNSIGFFCQKELQLEKMISFPVRFRLGSVDYTDQMEGKGKGVSSPGQGK